VNLECAKLRPVSYRARGAFKLPRLFHLYRYNFFLSSYRQQQLVWRLIGTYAATRKESPSVAQFFRVSGTSLPQRQWLTGSAGSVIHAHVLASCNVNVRLTRNSMGAAERKQWYVRKASNGAK
jgi:hypothetical protein